MIRRPVHILAALAALSLPLAVHAQEKVLRWGNNGEISTMDPHGAFSTANASLLFNIYEPLIRRMAGLGEAPRLPDPDRYAQQHAHCEVLVVGAGPAGLAAALAASRSGARVILCDERPRFGGSLLCDDRSRIDGLAAGDWVEAAIAELQRNPRVRLLPRTTAFGYFPHNHLGLSERLTDHLAEPPA